MCRKGIDSRVPTSRAGLRRFTVAYPALKAPGAYVTVITAMAGRCDFRNLNSCSLTCESPRTALIPSPPFLPLLRPKYSQLLHPTGVELYFFFCFRCHLLEVLAVSFSLSPYPLRPKRFPQGISIIMNTGGEDQR